MFVYDDFAHHPTAVWRRSRPARSPSARPADREVTPSGVRHIAYDTADFDYGKNKLSPQSWGDLGFAGLRAHYPLNSSEYKDEVVVFLGASYFRALGAGQRYGLSARGLAIDTVGGQGEEFPRFIEFWVVKPAARREDADALRAAGFAARERRLSVRRSARRRDRRRRARAPVPSRERRDARHRSAHEHVLLRREPAASHRLSSGSARLGRPDGGDRRGRVDLASAAQSEGDADHVVLDALAAGLRPDAAGPGTSPTTRTAKRAMSCGRAPGSSRSDLGDAGRVELVQLQTPDETNDNIVAYWVPREPPAVGQPLDLAYRLHWQGAKTTQHPPGAWVTQTRVGRGYTELANDEQQFVVDFVGPSLVALPADATVKAVVTAPANGEVLESNAYRVEATGAWRMTVRSKQLDPAQPTELRGFLQSGADVLTETWSNLLPPLLQR